MAINILDKEEEIVNVHFGHICEKSGEMGGDLGPVRLWEKWKV